MASWQNAPKNCKISLNTFLMLSLSLSEKTKSWRSLIFLETSGAHGPGPWGLPAAQEGGEGDPRARHPDVYHREGEQRAGGRKTSYYHHIILISSFYSYYIILSDKAAAAAAAACMTAMTAYNFDSLRHDNSSCGSWRWWCMVLLAMTWWRRPAPCSGWTWSPPPPAPGAGRAQYLAGRKDGRKIGVWGRNGNEPAWL